MKFFLTLYGWLRSLFKKPERQIGEQQMTAQFVETIHRYPGLILGGGSGITLKDDARWTQRWGSGGKDNSVMSPASGYLDGTGDFESPDERSLLISNYYSANPHQSLTNASVDGTGNIQHGAIAASLCVVALTGSPTARHQLVMRGSGAAASEGGYVARLSASVLTTYAAPSATLTLQIGKYVGGVFTSLGTTTKANGDKQVQIAKFQVIDTALKLRVWPLGTTEPSTWDLEITDASVTAAGWAGVGQRDGGIRIGFLSVIEYPSAAGGSESCYIPKTLTQRRDELEEDGEAPIVLFEAGVLGSSDAGTTGVESIAAVATMEFITRAYDYPYANTVYEGIVSDVGDFSQRMNEVLQGEATQGYGDVKVKNTNNRLTSWLLWNWEGRKFRLLLGRRGWRYCDMVVAVSGTIERVEEQPGVLVFKLRDSSNVLEKRIIDTLVGGSGAEKDKRVPVVYGTAFNVTPVLKDAVAHRYKVSDVAISDITDVRENGNSVIGSVTKDLANGEFTMTAAPAGLITCDVVGAATVVLTPRYTIRKDLGPQSMIQAICLQRAVLEDYQVNNEMVGVPIMLNQTCGVYTGTEDTPIREVLNFLSVGGSGFTAWSRWNEIYAGALVLDSLSAYAIHAFEEDDLVNRSLILKRVFHPAEPRQVQWQKNYTVQDAASIAGAVTETNRAKYSRAGTLYTGSASGSGLGHYTNYLLAKQKEPLDSPFITEAIGQASFDDEYANWKKPVGIFQFDTKRRAMEVMVGQAVKLTHSQYGFSAGKYGQVVGVSRKMRRYIATVDVAVQLDAAWPATTTAYPVVGEGDF